MVNKKSLATFVRTVGNQVIAGFKHFLNNVKIGGDLIISPDSLGNPATNVLTVDGNGVVKTATAFSGISVDSVSKVKHEVKAGVAINKGQAVYVTSADGTNMIVGLASNASEATSSKTMGLLESTVAINGKTNVITEGLLDGLNTDSANAGDPVWLGTGGNLIYGLANKPYAPAHLVFIGIVTRSNTNNGEIFVKVQNGFELNEIHDVDLKTNVPVNGEILGFNGTLWVNKTIAGWLGYTPANAANEGNWNAAYNDKINSAAVTGTTTKTLTLTQQDGGTITASWTDINTDAVTSVFGRTGAVIAVSGDYNTSQVTENTNLYFTNARARTAISLTTTGTSGAATYDNATGVLNVPQYQSVLTNPVTGTGTTNYVPKWTSGSAIGNSQIVDNGTNVLIGTTSDAGNRLQVNGSGRFVFRNDSNEIMDLAVLTEPSGLSKSKLSFLWYGNETASIKYVRGGNSTGGEIEFWTQPEGGSIAERMTILSNGNVGIGTTSPLAKLDVATNSSGTTIIVGRGSGQSSIKANSDNGGYLALDSTGGDLILNHYSSANIWMVTGGGNVGIGTTSPAYKLDINGASNSSPFRVLSTNTTSLRTFFEATSGNVEQHFLYTGNQDWVLGLDKADSNKFKLASADDGFASAKLTVTTSGNVGIGTTAPTNKLSVSQGGYNNSVTQLSVLNTSVAQKAHVGYDTVLIQQDDAPTLRIHEAGENLSTTISSDGGVSRIATSGVLAFSVNGNPANPGWNGMGGVEAMRMIANGNVGIGTTAPIRPLTVKSSNIAIRMDNSSNSNAGLEYYVSTGTFHNWLLGAQYNVANTFEITPSTTIGGTTYSTPAFVVNANGNVGIGTAAPDAKLVIAGSGTGLAKIGDAGFGSGNYTGISLNGTLSTGSYNFLSSPTDSALYINRPIGSTIRFRENNNDQVVIAVGGNVGIGTTSPSAKLHVIGNATVSATLSTANAKITGTLTDSFNQVGTAGQVLSSTGTGIEWITGGGGGGGSTIIVKDEGTTIGSSFTTLNFIGDNVNATASGSTAVIEVSGRASSGSVYYEDVATPFVIPGGGFANVEINTQPVMATVPSLLTASNKLMATITFGVSNVSLYEAFNGFTFRLYNTGPMSDVPRTTHSWNGYMSKNEGCTTTVFTFHIPIDPSVVTGGDTIVVQADALTNYTPEIYYCALTLMEGTN